MEENSETQVVLDFLFLIIIETATTRVICLRVKSTTVYNNLQTFYPCTVDFFF